MFDSRWQCVVIERSIRGVTLRIKGKIAMVDVEGLAVPEAKGVLEMSSKLRPLKEEEKYNASQCAVMTKLTQLYAMALLRAAIILV